MLGRVHSHMLILRNSMHSTEWSLLNNGLWRRYSGTRNLGALHTKGCRNPTTSCGTQYSDVFTWTVSQQLATLLGHAFPLLDPSDTTITIQRRLPLPLSYHYSSGILYSLLLPSSDLLLQGESLEKSA
jgi:hypothetical protein